MRKLFVHSFFVTVAVVLISAAAGLFSPAVTNSPETNNPPPSEPGIENKIPPSGWDDSGLELRVLVNGTVETLTMDEYLYGVVAAEMPATFEPDALKAQAVAARTYALRMFLEPRHTDCDLCDDFTHCAAFLTPDELRDKWNAEFDANYSKIYEAVRSTSGVYLTYDAAPILAVFHSSSHGFTESSEAVWNGAYPYLVSVPTPETPELVPNLISSVTISISEFVDILKNTYPAIDFSSDKSEWLKNIVTDSAGRVASLVIGGVEIKGVELRSLFGLRSTAVSVEIGDEVVFTTAGYGHGVGMSQYGANTMALSGMGWREILSAYYTGTGFSDDMVVA